VLLKEVDSVELQPQPAKTVIKSSFKKIEKTQKGEKCQ
jgi:hypothetical protein